MKPSGLLAFPVTPFTEEDALDRETFARHITQQLDARRATNGVGTAGGTAPSAWFVACGTGEFSALCMEEYRTVVRTAVTVVGGQAPVYAGAGGGPRAAREFALAAAECGADGVLLLPPYLVSCTPTGLVNHIRYVASASPLPIIVYQRANAVLDPRSVLALLDVANVVGIKDGIGDVDATSRIVAAVRTSGHPRASEFGFINGLPTAELSAPAYWAIGIDSYSSAVLSFAPEIAVAYYQAQSTGNVRLRNALLERFYLPLTELRDQVPGYAVALVKAGARLSGLPVGSVRPPLVEPTPEHTERLGEIIGQGKEVLHEMASNQASAAIT